MLFVKLEDGSLRPVPPAAADPGAEVSCPKCRSTQVTAQKRGFGLGRAAVGGVLLGPVGLLGGALGSRNIDITCLKCGHRFGPGA